VVPVEPDDKDDHGLHGVVNGQPDESHCDEPLRNGVVGSPRCRTNSRNTTVPARISTCGEVHAVDTGRSQGWEGGRNQVVHLSV
jgi:hypothetical protein